jgi:hypothetical protein
MGCAILAGSFHLGADNDLARTPASPYESLGGPAAAMPDNCPACLLEGLATALPLLVAPVAHPLTSGRVQPLAPPAPLLAAAARPGTRAPPAA